MSASTQAKTKPAPDRKSPPSNERRRLKPWLIPLAVALGLAALGALVWRDARLKADLSAASISELKVLSASSPKDTELSLELVRRYLLEQRFGDARRELERVLRLEPKSVDALYLRGLSYNFENQPVRAVETLEEALKIDPRHAPSLLRVGQIYVARSEFKKAIERLTEYVKIEPMDDGGHYWLGLVSFTSGYEKLGLWAMKRAIELAPDNPVHHLALGGFYLNSRDSAQYLGEAEKELREAKRLDPGEWMSRFRLAAVLLRKKSVPEAATELEEAVRINPRAYEPYFLLPQVYRQLGDQKKADHYQRIAETLARQKGPGRPIPPPGGLTKP